MTRETIAALAALSDPVRGRIYQFVRSQIQPVTRDVVAQGTGISRKLAAFHLDKLVRLGLLAVAAATEHRTQTPGRPPKLYSPSDQELSITIPERNYDFLGRILLEGLDTDAQSGHVFDSARQAAHRRGHAIGKEIRADRRLGRIGPERAMSAIEGYLVGAGFEPTRSSTNSVLLRNCPYRSLAEQWPDLVCELNRSHLSGILDGMGTNRVRVVLDPKPGYCCVELRAN